MSTATQIITPVPVNLAQTAQLATVPPVRQTWADAPPLPLPPPSQLGASGLRRPRRRTLVALGTAVVLVIGGTIAYTVLKPQPPSAASTVRAYFADLAAGDTGAALKLVDPSSGSDQLGTLGALRGAAILSAPASRPSDLTIVSTTQQPDLYGRSVSVVEVSYKLGPAGVSQDFDLAANVPDSSGAKQPFLLENPFLTLEVQDGSSRPMTVNGVSVGSQNVEAAVFPGLYTVKLQGDLLLAGDSRTAVFAPSGGGATLSVDFSGSTLAAGAQDAVLAQVKSALETCAQSTSPEPQNCPFSIYPRGTDDSVQWTVQTYPSPTVSVATGSGQGEEAQFIDDQQDGVVQYTDKYTDWTGTSQTTTGTTDFGASGYAAVNGSTITVTFDAYVF
jgi:hypothetical protein